MKIFFVMLLSDYFQRILNAVVSMYAGRLSCDLPRAMRDRNQYILTHFQVRSESESTLYRRFLILIKMLVFFDIFRFDCIVVGR